MTRKASFYLLSQDKPLDQYLFACRLCEKILSQKLQAYIHMQTEKLAHYMDDLLWSYRPESFLPHCLIDADIDEEARIIIGYADNYQDKADVLINFGQVLPPDPENFQRIVEIISSEESSRALGRQRWQAYKEAGFDLEKHEV